MPGVYSQFTNCTLTLKRYLGVVSDGHNEIPQQDKYTVRGMIESESKTANFSLSNYPGVNKPSSSFKGYITDEILFGTKTPQDITVVFDNGQVYDLVLHLPPPSPFYNESALLGVPCTLESR